MRRFLGEEKGNVIILVALAMVCLIGFTAMAVDVGYVYFRKAEMMSYADAASLAGGLALRDLGTSDEETVKSTVSTAVTAVLTANGFTETELAAMPCEIISAWGEVTPANSNQIYILPASREVQVTLARPERWYLARVLNLVRPAADPLEEVVVPAGARVQVTANTWLWDNNAGIVSFKKEGKKFDGVTLAGNSTISAGESGGVGIYSNYDLVIQGSAESENATAAGNYYRDLVERGIDAADYFGSAGNVQKLDKWLESPQLDWEGLEEAARAGCEYASATVNSDLGELWANGVYIPGDVLISGGKVNWGGVVFVEGNLKITGGEITGDPFIVVKGSVEIGGNTTTDTSASGSIYCLGDISVLGTASTFTGALWAEGNVFLTGNSASFIYKAPDENTESFIIGSLTLVR